MIHEKIDTFPHGMTEEEAKALFKLEDVYEVLETFDTINDSLDFIKEKYGEESYEYAKLDAENSINEEKSFAKYRKDIGDVNYNGFTSFSISDNIENYRKAKKYEPSFFWFPSGKVARVKLF